MNSKDLRNIASVYEAVYGGAKKVEKKDTRLVVTAADKKANTKAYQNYKAGNKAYKAADHLGEGKAESPEAEEAKDKKDDDLAGAPNKKGKKVKRWWDDDGDGIGYEKGEVKKVKEQNELVSKEVKDLQKAAETGKGKYAAKADKLPGVGTGKKVKEELELQEKQKDTPDQVAAVIDMYRSKKGTGEAVKDTEKGDKKAAKKERDYAAWERSKMKKDDPDWKHKKGSTTESVDVDYIDTVQKIKAAETEADIKRWKALEESGNFTDEEIQTIKEADIADILARLEKKRISKGGDPEESPLPAMKKYHAKKKKVKEEVESIEEADSLSGQVARWEAARQKRMKQRQSYERPSWIPRDQDHEDNWGSSKGEKKKG